MRPLPRLRPPRNPCPFCAKKPPNRRKTAGSALGAGNDPYSLRCNIDFVGTMGQCCEKRTCTIFCGAPVNPRANTGFSRQRRMNAPAIWDAALKNDQPGGNIQVVSSSCARSAAAACWMRLRRWLPPERLIGWESIPASSRSEHSGFSSRSRATSRSASSR